VSERTFLSIGEVLALLLDEFPDVTISKIRFLESQGLIEPERTASGYRRFSVAEVERLKYILREQRTNYLPLRVIKDRLDDETSDISRELRLVTEASTASHPSGRTHVPRPQPIAADPSLGIVADHSSRNITGTSGSESVFMDETALIERVHQPDVVLDQDIIASPTLAKEQRKIARSHADNTSSVAREDLLKQVEASPEFLAELERMGLITGHDVGDTTFFDPQSAAIAEAAVRFQELGIDARHLRTWRTSTDREIALFEQRILPLLRQRNPASRDEAIQMLEEFVTLGGSIRDALLAREVSRLVEGRH
jgi:DNA-binding transcriptional MerR regulator